MQGAYSKHAAALRTHAGRRRCSGSEASRKALCRSARPRGKGRGVNHGVNACMACLCSHPSHQTFYSHLHIHTFYSHLEERVGIRNVVRWEGRGKQSIGRMRGGSVFKPSLCTSSLLSLHLGCAGTARAARFRSSQSVPRGRPRRAPTYKEREARNEARSEGVIEERAP